jgi:hypothetical protein
MRYASVVIASLLAATVSLGGDELPKATRVIEGRKTTFPAAAIPEGVKALTGALESCRSLSDDSIRHTAADLKNAQKGEHVRFVFTRSLKVTILGKKLEVSETVFAEGVFWLRCGNDVVRCTKYTFDKMTPFREWYRQTLPAD